MTQAASLPSVRRALPEEASDRALFVAAIGFEERANHLFEEVLNEGAVPAELALLELSTRGVPGHLDSEARLRSHQRFDDLAEKFKIPTTKYRATDPYSWFTQRSFWSRALEHHDRVFVDLSGLTRLQIAAFASAYVGLLHAKTMTETPAVALGYTRPLSYDHKSRSRLPGISYDDTLIAPMQPGTILRRSGHARGMFLLGHEGERALTAFMEHPSFSGSVLISGRNKNDFLAEECRTRNSELLSYLSARRMPDAAMASLHREEDGWREFSMPADGGFQTYRTLVEDEVQLAIRDDAPVFLYLLGPKVACLFSALAAAGTGRPCWIVYSVPSHYDVLSVDGVGPSITYELQVSL